MRVYGSCAWVVVVGSTQYQNKVRDANQKRTCIQMSTSARQNTITSRVTGDSCPDQNSDTPNRETCSGARAWLSFSIYRLCLLQANCLFGLQHRIKFIVCHLALLSLLLLASISLKEHVGRFHIEARTRAGTRTQRSSNRQRVAHTKQFKVRFPTCAAVICNSGSEKPGRQIITARRSPGTPTDTDRYNSAGGCLVSELGSRHRLPYPFERAFGKMNTFGSNILQRFVVLLLIKLNRCTPTRG
jgi:hypothetical protein